MTTWTVRIWFGDELLESSLTGNSFTVLSVCAGLRELSAVDAGVLTKVSGHILSLRVFQLPSNILWRLLRPSVGYTQERLDRLHLRMYRLLFCFVTRFLWFLVATLPGYHIIHYHDDPPQSRDTQRMDEDIRA